MGGINDKMLEMRKNSHKMLTKEEHLTHTYTGHKISASLSYVSVKGRREDGKGRGGQNAIRSMASPPLYLDWLDPNMCVYDGQRSSEISCGMCTSVVSLTC
jgi:hypothetical protein